MAKKVTKKATRKSTAAGSKATAAAKKSSSAKAVSNKPAKAKVAAKAAAKTRPAAAPAGQKAPQKVKSPLSAAQLKEFKDMLLEKRRTLVGDLSGIESEALRRNRQDGSGDLSNMPTHPADVGSDNYEQEFTLGLLESERIMLTEIDEALERITEGTYGVCLGTGEPIGLPRLRARPWAKYGIEYARLLEKGLVRPDDDQEDGQDDTEDDFDIDADDEDAEEVNYAEPEDGPEEEEE